MPTSKLGREFQQVIGQTLLRDWDPIGIAGEPACSDEYDRYVGGVYRLLASSASEGQLADHLAKIETERMGLSSVDPVRLKTVARKLVEEYRAVNGS